MYESTTGASHLNVIAAAANVRPNRPASRREIRALGHVIQTGNQMTNTASEMSEKISTHRLGRASGVRRWYDFPGRRITNDSITADSPSPSTRQRTTVLRPPLVRPEPRA